MRLDHVVHAALFSSLGTLGAGCAFCPPRDVDEDFDERRSISQMDVDSYVALHGAPPSSCEELCELALERIFYDDIEELDVRSCATDIELPLETGSDTGDTATAPDQGELGEVHCAGHIVGVYAPHCKGRRPLGHRARRSAGADEAGLALAEIATLEGASVLAFEELAGWLAARGAPDDLIARCRAAAVDERRHARIFVAHARAQGGRPARPVRDPVEVDLLGVALHNAVEGCVHESWAAVEAHWQAVHAEPELRPAFARVAADETRHGQLAWDLQAWLLSGLSEEQRATVLAAQGRALDALPGAVGLRSGQLGEPAGGSGRALAERFVAGIRCEQM